MKNSRFSAVYLAALIIGAILIIANGSDHLYQGIVITIGVLVLVTSGYMLISSFARRNRPDLTGVQHPWYLYVAGVAGLAFGIWMLCMPGFFIGAAVYTFGVMMVIVGFLQVLFIYAGKRKATMSGWWYLIPWLVIAAGFVVIFIGPAKLGKVANIITGVALAVYGVNGLLSVGTSSVKNRRIDREEAREQSASVSASEEKE